MIPDRTKECEECEECACFKKQKKKTSNKKFCKMRIVIVGAGLSGLYAAMLLSKLAVTVYIFEKQAKVGGKARTMWTSHGPWEMGPSVFHTGQANIMHIIRKLQIPYKEITNCPNENIPDLPNIHSVPDGTAVKYVLDIHQLRSGNEISDMNYRDWKAGYDCEIKAQLCMFPNGWEDLGAQMAHYISRQPNIHLFLDTQVTHIKQHLSHVSVHVGNKKMRANYLILATSLEHIPPLDAQLSSVFTNTFRNARTKPTLRVYVEFRQRLPKNFPNDIFEPRSTFRWCIKIDPYSLLLSYVDGIEAQRRFSSNHTRFVQQCLIELNLGTLLSKVKKIHFADWSRAFTYFEARPILSKETKTHMHLVSTNISQTFLPFPEEQAWVEGHLHQALRCVLHIRSLLTKNVTKITKKQTS